MKHDLIDLLSYHPRCPVRPLDWRYRLADAIKQNANDSWLNVIPTISDDGPAIYYIRQKCGRISRSANDYHRKAGSWGTNELNYGAGILEAEALHSKLPAWERAILESRLLSHQTDEEIASRTGDTPATICWYERLFFHCRDRLNCDSYIQHFALNLEALKPQPEDVLRQLAFQHGPEILEFALQHWDGCTRLTNRNDGDENPHSRTLRIQVSLWILSRLLPVKARSSIKDLSILEELIKKQELIDSLKATPSSGVDISWTEEDRIPVHPHQKMKGPENLQILNKPKSGKHSQQKSSRLLHSRKKPKSHQTAQLMGRNTKLQSAANKKVTAKKRLKKLTTTVFKQGVNS